MGNESSALKVTPVRRSGLATKKYTVSAIS
jgi:hypothetical protein